MSHELKTPITILKGHFDFQIENTGVYILEDAFGVDIVTDNPEAEKEAQIYLIVKRDDGGEIQKVKQITLEEVMEKLLAFQN